MNTKKMRVVSLFSGCGGLDVGLEQAGLEVVWANDIDRSAVETYKYNINPRIVEGEIESIHANEIPDCDILAAGFPCQPFSTAGSRKGTEDERGTLFEEVIRIIDNKKPLVVLFENVRGLLSIRNLDGSLLLDTIITTLEDVEPGYNVTYKLMKASDYGVPQQRYRVFIIGVRKDIGESLDFPEPTHEANDNSLTVGSILQGIENLPNQDEVWNLSPQADKMVPFIPEGGSWKNVPYEELPSRLKRIRDNIKKYRSPNFYRRYSRDEINGTITAAATPENCGILHPLENRRYSVREIARIQSFPDNFIFKGDSIPAKYRMIGNAVPPKLGKVVGESILTMLNKVDSDYLEELRKGYKQLDLFKA